MRLMLALVFAALVSLPARAGQQVNDLRFQNGATILHTVWEKGPVESPEESLLHLAWQSSDRSAIEAPGSFKVELFMPGMGHGSSPTQVSRELDEQGQPLLGQYRVSSLYFTMPGLWEVRFTPRTPDGKSETQKFVVSL